MSTQQCYNVVIVGSGPAGLTAGIYAARAALSPLIIDGSDPGGQLMGTSFVENWPGNKSILGTDLMANMRDHAESLGCTFLGDAVVATDFSSRPFKLFTRRNKIIEAHSVIIASGAHPKKLGCVGEDVYWGRGITSCAVCDAAFYRDKKVVVIGGGDSAMESASFLTKFTQDITVVHILDKFTASKSMQDRVLNNSAIKIIYNSTVIEYLGNGQHVSGVIIKNNLSGQEQELSADGVFINIGMLPNTEYLKGQLELDSFGYLMVANHTKTSINGIFAAGDVADYRYRQAITSAGSGCMAALDAEHYIAEIMSA
jgi:thioredoxin reductase (NADPH)